MTIVPSKSHELTSLEMLRWLDLVLRVLLALAIVLPLVVLAIFAGLTYRQALADGERLVRGTVDVLHQHTLKVFETQELILDRADSLIGSRSWREIGDDASLVDSLKALERGRKQIASIWLLDADGNVRAASAAWRPGLNGADRDYFKAHVPADAGTFVGKAFVGRSTGKASFGFSRRRSNADGVFDGVLSISVAADYFTDAFREIAGIGSIDHVAALIRLDGEILARDPPRTEAPPLTADDPLMPHLQTEEEGTLWRVSVADGKERLLGFQRVGSFPLAVTFAIEKTAMLGTWRTDLFLIAGATAMGTLGFLMVAALALKRVRAEQTALIRLGEEAAKRAEIEERLKQSEKLELLGQLTGTIAHDFGNILTALIGNLTLVRDRFDDSRTRERAKDALTAAERGERLVRSLLAFARQQPLDIDVQDVTRLMREMESLLRGVLGTERTLVMTLPGDAWPILADATQLEMAILNLVVNARDAVAGGGVVEVACANTTISGDVNGLIGDFVALTVTDNGCGMAPEVLQHAFEPFFTTKPPGKGTGLGLASIYGFARQCGGAVRIKSEVGKGTAVTIFLPRAFPSG